MTNFFSVVPALSAAAELLQLVAEFTLLLAALVLSLIGDVAPVAARNLGRWAGRTVRLGHQARALYDAHLAPVVTSIDRNGRAFVIEQLGTAYPALTAAIALPAAPSTSPEPRDVAPARTRRQLLQLAKAQGLPRYSRRSTTELAALLTV